MLTVEFMDVLPANVFAKVPNMCANKVSFQTPITIYLPSLGQPCDSVSRQFLLFSSLFVGPNYNEIMKFIYP